jgi:serine protease Do
LDSLPQTTREAKLECGDLPKAGVPVVAYGHPGGHYFTGTKGIISGASSKYETELLQTDVPINRGNSGGPLINLSSGRVAGISTATASGMQNTNFALASRFACPIVAMLSSGKNPSPPRTDWVFYSGIEESETLKIGKAGNFGEQLGIQPGDVIVSVNGSGKPRNETQLLHAMRGNLEDLRLDIERNGKVITLRASVLPEPDVLKKDGIEVSGMLLNEIDDRLAQDLGVSGVELAYVERGSAAHLAEISAGTMLVSVNGMPTPNLQAAQQALTAAAEQKEESVLVFKKVTGKSNASSLFIWQERKIAIGDVRKVRADDTQ